MKRGVPRGERGVPLYNSGVPLQLPFPSCLICNERFLNCLRMSRSFFSQTKASLHVVIFDFTLHPFLFRLRMRLHHEADREESSFHSGSTSLVLYVVHRWKLNPNKRQATSKDEILQTEILSYVSYVHKSQGHATVMDASVFRLKCTLNHLLCACNPVLTVLTSHASTVPERLPNPTTLDRRSRNANYAALSRTRRPIPPPKGNYT